MRATEAKGAYMRMSLDQIRQSIAKLHPYNEQEERDQRLILKYLEQPDVLTRENDAMHMTVSGWIVNHDRDKVLMCYHKIYDSWSWLGGHADGDTDLLKVALKEVHEESGLLNVKPVSEDVYSVEILTVDGHVKKGKYVSSHLHLNVTYLLEADDKELLVVNKEENKGLSWYGLDEAIEASSEPWFREHIYTKLNGKLRTLVKE